MSPETGLILSAIIITVGASVLAAWAVRLKHKASHPKTS